VARGRRSLKGSRRHQDRTYARWAEEISQREWAFEQCGECRWWIPLTGAWGTDWGACSNPASPFDARVRFEHDGCPAFELAEGGWVIPDEPA